MHCVGGSPTYNNVHLKGFQHQVLSFVALPENDIQHRTFSGKNPEADASSRIKPNTIIHY